MVYNIDFSKHEYFDAAENIALNNYKETYKEHNVFKGKNETVWDVSFNCWSANIIVENKITKKMIHNALVMISHESVLEYLKENKIYVSDKFKNEWKPFRKRNNKEFLI